MSFSFYKKYGEYSKPFRSISEPRFSPSSYLTSSLQYGSDVKQYTQSATSNPYEYSVYDKTNYSTSYQHKHVSDHSTKKSHISPVLATSSTTETRSKLPSDLYSSTLSQYQDDEVDVVELTDSYLKHASPTSTSLSINSNYIPNSSKYKQLDQTTATSSLQHQRLSHSTTQMTIPSVHRYRYNRTTTTLHQQDEMYEIESYINRLEGNSLSGQPNQSTTFQNQSTHHPANRLSSTSVRSLSRDLRDNYEIPNKTVTSTFLGQSRTASSLQSDHDDYDDGGSDEEHIDIRLQEGSTVSEGYTRSLEDETMMDCLTDATSMTSIYGSGDKSSLQRRRRKRRKMDPNITITSDSPQALEFGDLFKNRVTVDPPEGVTQPTKSKRRNRRKVKDNDTETTSSKENTAPSSGLVKMLRAITLDLGQGQTGLDEKEQVLAFFEDETPKDNGQKLKPNQSLVNGFDGFSDNDDNDFL